MILKSYSIYDRKTEIHHQPFFAHTDPHAVRIFKDTLANPDSPFNRHPDDYDLYYCGEFDDTAGVFISEEKATFLVHGTSVQEAPSVAQ